MKRISSGATCLLAIIATGALAQDSSDRLEVGFRDPPASARPRVWWHWMNGNITKEGVKPDLEWMKRIGLGGFQNFDAALGTPQVVDERLVYMTPEWIDALRYTVDLATTHDLEMAIASSAGWSATGGPWVRPEQAMKKLVWSGTEVLGGRRFSGKLPAPPGTTGPFQDVPLQSRSGAVETAPRFYADSAVIAYPLAGADQRGLQGEPPLVRSHAGASAFDANILGDGVLTNSVKLKFGAAGEPACISYDYRQPRSIAALKLAMPIGADFFRSPLALASLQASDDGESFRKVAEIPAGSIVQHTISFAPVEARYFRVCFAPPPPPYTDLLDATAPGANMAVFPVGVARTRESVEVHELELYSTPRVHRVEEKAGFAFVADYYSIPTGPVDGADAVPTARVIDLTARMQPDGRLEWTPPPGRWRILRFGYSLTGKENHPATEEATGLEVDKLDRDHLRAYLETYLQKYEDALGADRIGAQGVRALLVDSIEVGAQNWTESLPAEFRRRRGYDLLPWMPALTGVVVGSAEQSDRFLYDFRRTIGELLVDNYYREIAQIAQEHGLIQYGEALEQGRPVLGDDMAMRRHADVPMAAMWAYSAKAGAPTPVRFADMRGAASVAHIYGQNLVAAESLTSAFAPWAFAPRDLKPMMDLEFVLGVNRPVIHTSVHQPLLGKAPGLTLLIFGQYFNRNETWAEQAGPWVSYLSRTSYLLQQGEFAADVVYFYGEEAPLTALYREQVTPDAPLGYGFDFANADVVMNQLEVDDGLLVTDSGMRYRVLYLGGTSARMTLPVLRSLRDLAEQGATIVGERPIGSPSLADDAEEFDRLADELWSADGNGGAVGRGRVIAERDVNRALQSLGVERDFDYRKPQPDSEIMFLHRRLADGDLYFLTNRRARAEVVEASFRVAGERPEIWRAESGRSEAVSYRIENGRTFVTLPFAAHDAFFVVFREPTQLDEFDAPEPRVEQLATLADDWTVSFQPGRGGPATPQALGVGSWTGRESPAIRYFSGTAAYRQTFEAPAAWFKNPGRLMLDLGDVRELAEVVVNGRSLGIVWRPPYRIDVTEALKPGANDIEVRVTNLWVNRLIGDAQPDAQKATFTIFPPYRADAPLRPSGLLGPVRLERLTTAESPGIE